MPRLWFLVTCFVLSGCGGGGGGGGGSSTPAADDAVNVPPVLSVPSNVGVNESVMMVATLEATDPDVTDTLSFSVTGIDAGFFVIDQFDQLSFNLPTDFQNPSDSNADNSYEVNVSVQDGQGGVDSVALTVNVINLLEGRVVDAPLSGSQVFIDLNGNLELDDNEESVLTDGTGHFQLPDNQTLCPTPGLCNAVIVSVGGVDLTTGEELNDFVVFGTSASNANFVVSPISSLLVVAEDKEALLFGLGLSINPQDVTLIDPWQGAQDGDAVALELTRLNQQLGLIIQTVQSLEPGEAVRATARVTEEIVSITVLNDSIDLTSNQSISTLLMAASKGVVSNSVVDAVAKVVADVNSVIADPAFNPTSEVAAAVLQTTQDQLQKSVTQLITGDVSTSTFTSENSVDNLIVLAGRTITLIDSDDDGLADLVDTDDDSDGVLDLEDVFPLDKTESLDSDLDGLGNNADKDDDNDDIADDNDAYPLISLGGRQDTDRDGSPDNCDEACRSLGMVADQDDDNDNVIDSFDAYPLIALGARLDTDSDGQPDNCDAACTSTGMRADQDDDNDGINDDNDQYPRINLDGRLDTDKDGQPDDCDAVCLSTGMAADPDDDNDDIIDSDDAFPLIALDGRIDTDRDGVPNDCDLLCQSAGMSSDVDDDNDGVIDADDAFPLISLGSRTDSDADGQPNDCESDCLLTGMTADPDDDNDDILDANDAYPLISLGGRPDNDRDGRPDNCDAVCTATGMISDSDDDNDGITDADDAFPLISLEDQLDTDGDGRPNICEAACLAAGMIADLDDDDDGIEDSSDAYPLVSLGGRLDTDSDGRPDECDADCTETGMIADADDDNDGIADVSDAFPLISLGGRPDADQDGSPDDCDTTCIATGMSADPDDDNDGITDADDAFPFINLGNRLDTDGDGRPNDCDAVCVGLGMTADLDDDNDGVSDGNDAYPLISLGGRLDTDGDGLPDNCDPTCTSTGLVADLDDDSDGILDVDDTFPLINLGNRLDTDGDGQPNGCDTACILLGMTADADDDNDGVADVIDEFPLNPDLHTAPIANTESLQLNLLPLVQSQLTGTLSGSAQDSRALTFSLMTNASSGVVTLADPQTGAFSYETLAGVTDQISDAFTFKVNDGFVDSLVATVTIDLRTDPLYQYQWYLDNTGQSSFASTQGTFGDDINVASVIAQGLTGNGIIVAVVDTGLEIAHEDLSANVVPGGSYNFSNGTTDPTNTSTFGDHGTSVAGLVAATGWNNLGGRGVAPNAQIKGFNFLKLQSNGNNTAALGGGSYAADVDIFNQSYGYNTTNDFIVTTMVEAQYKSGVTSLRGGKGAIYVRSAGNGFYGYFGGSAPATCGQATSIGITCQNASMDPEITLPQNITVGALGADGVKSSYSTAGSALWVSAPGGEFGLTYPAMMTTDQSSCDQGYVKASNFSSNAFNNVSSGTPHPENANCNYTAKFNGTSSAAPVLSGAIALILEAKPTLTWRDIKHILASTSTQIDISIAPLSLTLADGTYIAEPGWTTNGAGYVFHNWYGFGRVDVAAAVAMAQSMTPDNLGVQIESSPIFSGTVSLTIPDNSIFGATHSIVDSNNLVIEAVRVKVNIAHLNTGDLGIELTSPSGTRSVLFTTRNGFDTSDNLNMYLLSNAFYDENSAGTWTLRVIDGQSNAVGGVLTSWQMVVFGHSP